MKIFKAFAAIIMECLAIWAIRLVDAGSMDDSTILLCAFALVSAGYCLVDSIGYDW
jgi:hypothetical protein